MLEIISGQAASKIQASKSFQNKSFVWDATHVFALLTLMYREIAQTSTYLG